MMWFRPKSLFSHMVLILLGGLILVQSISLVFHLRERDRLMFRSNSIDAAQRIANAVHLLNSLQSIDRDKAAASINSPTLRISLDGQPPGFSNHIPERDSQAASFSEVLSGLLGGHTLVEAGIFEADNPTQQKPSFTATVRLEDGTRATFSTHPTGDAFPTPPRVLLNMLILLAAVFVLSLLAVRHATRPLNTLASAAEKLGKDINSPPLIETGPTEVRRAAHAFNTMQSRLANYIQERTRLLAAMSHDLKTPITRLRLRAELLEDDQLREKFERDLEEMESMVASTLDFMRGVDNPEPLHPVDIMALLESIEAEAIELGHQVRVEGFTAQPFWCKPATLKRCLTNLIDNAVKYGESATVIVNDEGDQLQVHILDQGPGIPETELERVFQPFYRLESSRSRDTGGTGLGLGIARNIAQMHHGDLVLRNRTAGGLEAILTLPRESVPHSQ